jgi:hypothetical protein
VQYIVALTPRSYLNGQQLFGDLVVSQDERTTGSVHRAAGYRCSYWLVAKDPKPLSLFSRGNGKICAVLCLLQQIQAFLLARTGVHFFSLSAAIPPCQQSSVAEILISRWRPLRPPPSPARICERRGAQGRLTNHELHRGLSTAPTLAAHGHADRGSADQSSSAAGLVCVQCRASPRAHQLQQCVERRLA